MINIEPNCTIIADDCGYGEKTTKKRERESENGTSVEEEDSGSIRIDSRQVRSRPIHEAREAPSASGIGLTSVLFLLRTVNPRILALTRCRTGRVTESVFINGPLGSGGRSVLRSEDLTRAPAFCALKYRLIAPGFCGRFCKISCVYPPRCSSSAPRET